MNFCSILKPECNAAISVYRSCVKKCYPKPIVPCFYSKRLFFHGINKIADVTAFLNSCITVGSSLVQSFGWFFITLYQAVVPTAVLCVNINDWKFFDRNFGEEESDRLITIVADIIKEYAPQNAIIGRIEGDIFNVLLPMTEENEARSYLYKIQDVCQEYEDEILAQSIAVGCAMKTNVEQTYRELFSDAEYDMLENKVELKKLDGYRERIEKGLNLK